MNIVFSIDNAAEVTAAFANAPAVVMDELQNTMHTLTAYLERETRENTPTALGTLRNAWTSDVAVAGDLVTGTVLNPLPYALPVETGTRPHFPPIEPLVSWVEQKIGLQGPDARRMAYGIQRKIGKYGSPAMGMAHYALADGRSTIDAEFADCAQRIRARIAGGAGTGTNTTPGAAA